MARVAHQRLVDKCRVGGFSADRWCPPAVGASLLAKIVNDNAGNLVVCGVLGFFASKLAPTRWASVVELAALGLDGFGQGTGFVLFVAQRRLFEGGDGGQKFFAGLGDAENV